MPPAFEWKRFWCPRGETIDLSDRGYLSDPETEWGKSANPDLVPFERLAETPCLALLGEPGIGKSWALRSQRVESEGSLDGGRKVMWLDLRSFGDEGRLQQCLFDSDIFGAWRKGDWVLHLFLDSLDECLLRIDNIAALLADELPKQPVERLRLRIACRTVPWPTILETALVSLFTEFKAYEMAPLRRIDVRSAAESSGIVDPEAFLARIEALDVSSLAIKPVTLKFLISTYLRDGEFPKNHIDLYEKGCRILCEESSESRRGSGRMGRLDANQRLAIASRIAAVTQFANRFAIYTGGEGEGVPLEDALLSDLSGGVERTPDDMTVSVDALREVLDTGLFSSRGSNRIGWAHQTYAEFLAARYCKYRNMPIQQIRSLIFHPVDQGRRLVPQLHEVAAWMSVINPEILKAVADSDPEALLGAAAASLSDDQRRLVVAAILDQCSQGRTLHLRWSLFSLYKKLNHPALQDQLSPYPRDSTKSIGARYVAIVMARVCGVQNLGSDLADIALDISAGATLRNMAAAAAAEIGSAEVRARLRPLALSQAGEDPDDELKGSGLKALWPGLITASELFSLIAPPKEQQLSGTYSSFLYGHFLQKLDVTDIPLALEWFSKQGHRQTLPGVIDRLMNDVVRLAWENLDQPGLASGLATAVLSRLRLHDSLIGGLDQGEFGKKVQEDHNKRRMLLTRLLPQLEANHIWALLTLNVPLLGSLDFEWLIDRVLSGEFSASASIEARLVRYAFDANNPESIQKLCRACRTNEILNSECGRFFAPILLDSEEARLLRENLKQENQWRTPKLLQPPPSERVARDLHNIEEGRIADWLRLTFDLGLEVTSTNDPTDWERNLTETPGWNGAERATRDRILSAAVGYVNEGNPQNEEWFETSSIPYPAIGGFRALALLLVAEDERLNAVSIVAWRKWVPILLRFPCSSTDKLKVQARLLQRAYELIPEEIVHRVMQLMDSVNERNGHLFLSREIQTCWDERMERALLEKSKNPALKPQILGSILELLLQHHVAGARESVESRINAALCGSELERSQMLAAARALMTHATDAGWARIWPILNENKQLGREIVEAVSYADAGHGNFITRLTESQLGNLYLWMVDNYPYAEQHLGFGAMGPGDTALMLRDSIIEHLKKRGTFAACDAIRHVMERLPQYSWLRHHLEEAESLARAATWRPASTHQFLVMALDRDKRLVESGAQLIEVILESLDRLNSKLQGELPAAKDLWNEWQKAFQPKDEQDLAIYVARHVDEDLKGRGIIVNREVQIRRGIGGGTGQATDIHIDAVIQGAQAGTYERIYVIVEVKGNWNTELRTAMETQLRNRYLKGNRCKDGIYLVGWFSCAKWDDTDYRKRRCPQMGLCEAKEFFLRQASQLSNDGYCIISYVLDVCL